MGQQDVDRLVARHDVEAQAADAGPGVEDERAAVGQSQLDARRVAPVARRLRARSRNRPARAPDLDLHAAPSPAIQKKIIAPWKPSAPMIGRPLTSTSCSPPAADRIVWRACAGRLARRAIVSGCFSIGIGSPSSPNGPNIATHWPAAIDPLSSKRLPSSTPAASLKKSRSPGPFTRNAGVDRLDSRLRARISSSGRCEDDSTRQLYASPCPA